MATHVMVVTVPADGVAPMLQRLFRIETCRMMALLALPVARQQSARLVEIDSPLALVTCAAVSQRLRDVSERVALASALLSTRVDIARGRQNQALLFAAVFIVTCRARRQPPRDESLHHLPDAPEHR